MEIDVKAIGQGIDQYTLDRTIILKCPHNMAEDDVERFLERNKDKHLILSEEVKKRSLDANAYCWVLIQKIAEVIGSDKWSVYIEEIKKYSRAFTHICCREEIIPKLVKEYRAYEVLGDIAIGQSIGKQVRVYFGSSTFSQEEMNVFLNGICQDAHELGIQTLEDIEIERIVKLWK